MQYHRSHHNGCTTGRILACQARPNQGCNTVRGVPPQLLWHVPDTASVLEEKLATLDLLSVRDARGIRD